MAAKRVCIAQVVAAHGVRGEVKLKSFTERPEDVAAYGPLESERGERRFEVKLRGVVKELFIARLSGIENRTAAEGLRGARLYVPRSALPEIAEEDSFYHTDLIGLAVEDMTGQPLGRVAAVENHGAGDVLEIETPNGRRLHLPFTRQVVPLVDLAAGRIEVDPPTEIEAKEASGEEKGHEGGDRKLD